MSKRTWENNEERRSAELSGTSLSTSDSKVGVGGRPERTVCILLSTDLTLSIIWSIILVVSAVMNPSYAFFTLMIIVSLKNLGIVITAFTLSIRHVPSSPIPIRCLKFYRCHRLALCWLWMVTGIGLMTFGAYVALSQVERFLDSRGKRESVWSIGAFSLIPGSLTLLNSLYLLSTLSSFNKTILQLADQDNPPPSTNRDITNKDGKTTIINAAGSINTTRTSTI